MHLLILFCQLLGELLAEHLRQPQGVEAAVLDKDGFPMAAWNLAVRGLKRMRGSQGSPGAPIARAMRG